ncbi:MAG: helix-turn-helix transcriptional regulator [Acidobacteriota bacterium]
MEQLVEVPYSFKILPPSPVNFAELCKELRQELHFTQEEMAKFLGVARRTYNYWESGEREPSAEVAFWLAQMKQKMESANSADLPQNQKDDRIEELAKQVAEIKTTLDKLTKERKS